MKKTILALSLAALAQGFALPSAAAVVDFESLAHADDLITDAGWTYIEKGFQFDNLSTFAFATWGNQSLFFNGSTALMNDNDAGLTRLSQVGNGAFALYSVDLSVTYPNLTEDGVDVSFTGIRNDSSTVTQTFHVLDGAPQTFSFAGFTNLASVRWTNTASYHQFDNINVAAVPEPETYALMLAGLGLIGFAARRRAGSR